MKNDLVIISNSLFDHNINLLKNYCNDNKNILYILPDIVDIQYKYDPFLFLENIENEINFSNIETISILCTIQWARIFSKIPLLGQNMLFSDKTYNLSEYRKYFGDYLLNNKGFFLSYDMMKDSKELIFSNYNDIFIRPNSGLKTFSGFCVDKNNFDFEIDSLDKLTGISYKDFIFISNKKNVHNEVRYWIFNNEIITHTSNANEELNEFAKESSKIFSTIEDFFVLDVAYHGKTPKVVEINAASTSGIYDSNPIEIIERMQYCNKI